MTTIHCPHCGSPVMLRGTRWECGYCGDFGAISSLQPSDKAKLMCAATPSVQLSFTVTDSSNEENSSRSFSRDELEDMVRRWDFSEDEWACRDLLIAAFPEVKRRWSAEELEQMDTQDLLSETCEKDPRAAINMIELLLNTAEGHLQDKEVANQLLGWDMYDLLINDEMLPLLVEELKQNDRLAHHLFQSAYVDRPQLEILNVCGHLGEKSLQQKLLQILKSNPLQSQEIGLEIEDN